jgi:hypothetical protein
MLPLEQPYGRIDDRRSSGDRESRGQAYRSHRPGEEKLNNGEERGQAYRMLVPYTLIGQLAPEPQLRDDEIEALIAVDNRRKEGTLAEGQAESEARGEHTECHRKKGARTDILVRYRCISEAHSDELADLT